MQERVGLCSSSSATVPPPFLRGACPEPAAFLGGGQGGRLPPRAWPSQPHRRLPKFWGCCLWSCEGAWSVGWPLTFFFSCKIGAANNFMISDF